MKAGDPTEFLTQRMKEAVAWSTAHVHGGGIPFSAFVVDAEGTVFGRGINRVREHHDPTAHAEVEAMRNACRATGRSHLQGTALLASGESCAVCYLSALYAGVSQVLFAVDRHEAAVHGFDYRNAYTVFTEDLRDWRAPTVHKLPVPGGTQPFLAFRSRVAAR
jgi:guanine deaminase